MRVQELEGQAVPLSPPEAAELEVRRDVEAVGRKWPVSKMRTETVSAGKRPSPPRPAQNEAVAVLTSLLVVFLLFCNASVEPTHFVSSGQRAGLCCVQTIAGVPPIPTVDGGIRDRRRDWSQTDRLLALQRHVEEPH